MSQPVDRYRGDPHGDRYRGDQYGDPHGDPHGDQYGGPHGDQYGGDGWQGYRRQEPRRADQHGEPWGYGTRLDRAAPAEPAGRLPEPAVQHRRRAWRPGLALTIAGLAVLVLSSTVLPWVRLDAAGQAAAETVALPQAWRVATEHQAFGFGGWYVVLLSYPLAALGVLLALASVLESAALKVIWAGLGVLGLGALVLRYGLGPLTGVAGTPDTPDTPGTTSATGTPGTIGEYLTTQQAIAAGAALAALVVVVFAVRTAVSTFRRLAGLILLVTAGLHGAAVFDLGTAPGAGQLGVGAYAPALGYLLTALAAFIGPRRLPIG